ncbi:hypothetical protein M153_28890001067 [Pseudoloma neurophilia]|uniref:Uncharacterized protein n=1 Tax=Pseudoloma neurophilia TaxID=146866 RepID=A0A0R0M099_9MICR|nr:hypothetical protein M153_28890001067 [Pseudoloma neurophilia]
MRYLKNKIISRFLFDKICVQNLNENFNFSTNLSQKGKLNLNASY